MRVSQAAEPRGGRWSGQPLLGLGRGGDLAAGGPLREASLAGWRGRRTAGLLPGGLLTAVDGMRHGSPLEVDDLGGQSGGVDQGDSASPSEPTPGLPGIDQKDPVTALRQGPVGVAEDDDIK